MNDLGLQTSYLSGKDYETFWAGQEDGLQERPARWSRKRTSHPITARSSSTNTPGKTPP